MFLQLQTPKQFLVPFKMSVGLKNYQASLDLFGRCQERVKKLFELSEIGNSRYRKNKGLVDDLVGLRNDFSILSKRANAVKKATVFFVVVLSVGYTDLAVALGLTIKENFKKEKKFMNQQLSFIEVSKRILLQ